MSDHIPPGTNRQVLTNTLVSRLRDEYVQQSARCGEEDSHERSLLAQEAADEIERLTHESKWGTHWHRLVESIATILEVNSAGGFAELAFDIPAAIQKLRAADEPSEVPDCLRCGVAHYPPCPERPLGHTGGSDCPCSECVAWRTSKSGEGR